MSSAYVASSSCVVALLIAFVAVHSQEVPDADEALYAKGLYRQATTAAGPYDAQESPDGTNQDYFNNVNPEAKEAIVPEFPNEPQDQSFIRGFNTGPPYAAISKRAELPSPMQPNVQQPLSAIEETAVSSGTTYGKVCNGNKKCSFSVTMKTTSAEDANKDKKMAQTLKLYIEQGTATGTWTASGSPTDDSAEAFSSEKAPASASGEAARGNSLPELQGNAQHLGEPDKEAKLLECMKGSKRTFTQVAAERPTFEACADGNTNCVFPGSSSDTSCQDYIDQIDKNLVSMVDMIAQPTTWSKTGEELLQFTLVEDDFNGRRTTHSNRVKQPNGKTIVYRTHRTKVPQIFMSVPTGQSATYTKNTVEPPQGTIGASDAPVNTAFAPQGASSPPSEVKPLTTAEQTAEANKGEDTYQFQGAGSSTHDANGVTEKTTDTTTTKIGSKSGNGSSECAQGTKNEGDKEIQCEHVPTDQSGNIGKVDMDVDSEMTITKLSEEEATLPTISLEQYKQTLKDKGIKLVYGHEAIAMATARETARAEERQREDPSDPEAGMPQFMQMLEASHREVFQKPATKLQLEKLASSPKVRRLIVNALHKNQIKNPRAVQELMHVIGRVGMKQAEAVTQLLALASDNNLTDEARGQALGGLVQAKCWDHSLAIRPLGKLATKRPKTHIQWLALHIQHGLLAHTQHCANGHYEGASQYSDLLQDAREGLAAAVEYADESGAAKWLDALGNSNSQSSEHTAAVAAIAANRRESPSLRLVAIRNLGKLWTPAAQAQLQKLSMDKCEGVPAWVGFKSTEANPGCRMSKDIRRGAQEALTGEYLERGDPRRPSGEVEPMSLAQSGGTTSFEFGYEKSWPTPSSGDIRAEPKIGLSFGVENENDGKGGGDASICLHGYAGVDAKAWDWTVSVAAAGAKLCASTDDETNGFNPYFKVLGIQIWPKAEFPVAFSGGHAQPDNQGKCKYDINGAPYKFKLAWSTTFFEKEKIFLVGGFPINGMIKMEGEVGVLTGYNKGDLTHSSTPNDIKTKCKSDKNEMMFMIPYAQATITGELALDLLLAKGGVGLNVVLIKFSLPVTDEFYKDTSGKAVGSCGGLTLTIEGLGGKVYAFLDILKSVEIKTGGGCWFCFWTWEISRVWHRAFDFSFYEWTSPLTWSSDNIKCKGDDLTDEVKEDAPMKTPALDCKHKESGYHCGDCAQQLGGDQTKKENGPLCEGPGNKCGTCYLNACLMTAGGYSAKYNKNC
jgi:hypothetical protein